MPTSIAALCDVKLFGVNCLLVRTKASLLTLVGEEQQLPGRAPVHRRGLEGNLRLRVIALGILLYGAGVRFKQKFMTSPFRPKHW
jgi:hypothetical protein